jgi:dynein heavy chain 2, cytosolic
VDKLSTEAIKKRELLTVK